MPPELAYAGGTTGLIVVLCWIANKLWNAHLASDADMKTQRDESIAGWKAQSEATKAIAASNDRVLALLEQTGNRRRDYDK